MVQKVINYNKLYGILTNGETAYRKTNYATVAVSDYVRNIIDTLVPSNLEADEKAHRAELFIKLCLTDYDCCELVERKDPYNSYKIVAYDIDLDNTYSIEDIGNKIKALHLKDSERDFGAVEHIINAVKIILESL